MAGRENRITSKLGSGTLDIIDQLRGKQRGSTRVWSKE